VRKRTPNRSLGAFGGIPETFWVPGCAFECTLYCSLLDPATRVKKKKDLEELEVEDAAVGRADEHRASVLLVISNVSY